MSTRTRSTVDPTHPRKSSRVSAHVDVAPSDSECSHVSTRSAASRASTRNKGFKAKPIEEHKSNSDNDDNISLNSESSQRVTRRAASKSSTVAALLVPKNPSLPVSRMSSKAKLLPADSSVHTPDHGTNSRRLKLSDELLMPDEYFSSLLKTPNLKQDSANNKGNNENEQGGKQGLDEVDTICGSSNDVYNNHVITTVANLTNYLFADFVLFSLLIGFTYLVAIMNYEEKVKIHWETTITQFIHTQCPSVMKYYSLLKFPAFNPAYSSLSISNTNNRL